MGKLFLLLLVVAVLDTAAYAASMEGAPSMSKPVPPGPTSGPKIQQATAASIQRNTKPNSPKKQIPVASGRHLLQSGGRGSGSQPQAQGFNYGGYAPYGNNKGYDGYVQRGWGGWGNRYGYQWNDIRGPEGGRKLMDLGAEAPNTHTASSLRVPISIRKLMGSDSVQGVKQYGGYYPRYGRNYGPRYGRGPYGGGPYGGYGGGQSYSSAQASASAGSNSFGGPFGSGSFASASASAQSSALGKK